MKIQCSLIFVLFSTQILFSQNISQKNFTEKYLPNLNLKSNYKTFGTTSSTANFKKGSKKYTKIGDLDPNFLDNNPDFKIGYSKFTLSVNILDKNKRRVQIDLPNGIDLFLARGNSMRFQTGFGLNLFRKQNKRKPRY